MRVYFSDHLAVPLPPGHRFPMGKYARLRERLIEEGVVPASALAPAPAATRAELCAAHDPGYVDAVCAGTLDERAQRRIGLPWSPALVARTLASVGGTLAAARAALDDGRAGNLAGGTHHAHRAFGSGFCVWNDLAVAAAVLLAEGRVERVLVFDADVHQGDGTATLFADEPRVFTCSLHGARNFPFVKPAGDLDVELADGADDAAVLAAIDGALAEVARRFAPDLVLYQAGVDPLAEDKLGRLAMTAAGLAERDRRVLTHFAARGVPLALTLGGGYADPIERTIEAHVNTYRVAAVTHGWIGRQNE
ncbi:MAG: histone deacetylase [Kofleriaceae bacterium]|nr:histone deacetylase [Kofleriaceae bacterium]MBP9171408.1 histone deacetylase [Kofleriaceae bacterium]MBP9863132.1 histone deacetylase [Kofleriaceae bacterium]